MKNLISIGQFSKQTGLSSRVLRLYDELEMPVRFVVLRVVLIGWGQPIVERLVFR